MLRQEEMERLAMDARALSVQLEYLKGRLEERLTPAQENEAMKKLLRSQQHSLWRAHSLLSNRLVRTSSVSRVGIVSGLT